MEEDKKLEQNLNNSNEKLHITDVICLDFLNDKPFYMSSRSGNKPDYNSFGYNEYKQYDI
jgi:hypothetical protein